MRFTFDGRKYGLSFQRAHQQVTVMQDRKAVGIVSKHPYTTVTLYEHTASVPAVVASTTVGCLPADDYSNEAGRVMALKALTQVLTKRNGVSREFRRVMWEAYMNRGKQPNKIIEGEVTQVVEQPAQQEAVH